jgi:hypothetical protein
MVKFTDSLRIRCPPALAVAIDIAAARNMMTASEYVRRCVIDRLRADNIDPLAPTSLSEHHKQRIESLIPKSDEIN